MTDVYLPKLGGIEQQVAGLVQAQRDLGYEVSVLTATADVESASEIVRLPAQGWFGLPLNFRAGEAIQEFVQLYKPDVVHLHIGVVSQFAWLAFFRLRKQNLRLVGTVHSVWGALAVIGYKGANRIFNFSHDVTLSSVSQPAANRVAKAIGKPVMVCPNGVDLSHWEPNQREAKSRLRLVTATRLAARKRVLPLLLVLFLLKRKVAPNTFELNIAGSGILQGVLRFTSRILGLSANVNFVGRLNKHDLAALYANSDIYIQLSRKEAFGLAAIEARATGLPVLGRSGSGFAEFITDGLDGKFFDTDTAAASYLADLIRNPSRLTELQIAAENRPIHGWAYAVQKVAELYDESTK